jgi:hypothetical protein
MLIAKEGRVWKETATGYTEIYLNTSGWTEENHKDNFNNMKQGL